VTRDIDEALCDQVRGLAKTKAFEHSARQRKKVEMAFAHPKRILKLDRLRARGLSGARYEMPLAATAQNLRMFARAAILRRSGRLVQLVSANRPSGGSPGASMRSLAGSLADNQERVLRPHDVLAKALQQKQDNSDRRVMELSRERLSQAIDREAKGLIRLYDFSEDATVSLLSESENKVYLVRDPGRAEDYVIRVNSGRLGYHTPPNIASELTWLTALRRNTDIVVPTVLAGRDGSLVQTFDATDLDKPRHAAIYSFLSGTEPPEDALRPGFERLGEISARMHRHAQGWQPPAGFARPSWTPEVILEDRLNWGPWRAGHGVEGETIQLLSRLADVVSKRLAGLPNDREHFGLIHADLRLANFLVEGDRTAIIDFDDCGFGWYLFDLATALSFLEQRPDAPELVACWLTGYRKVAEVPAVVDAEIPTLIMLRRLQLIGWVGYQRQRLDFAREIAPQFTIDSCRLAEDYLARFA
jgi:Ser/Thr protein kinase RdoA (MazF antagonist)